MLPCQTYPFLVLNAGKVTPYPSQPNQVIGWDIVLVGFIKCRLSLFLYNDGTVVRLKEIFLQNGVEIEVGEVFFS